MKSFEIISGLTLFFALKLFVGVPFNAGSKSMTWQFLVV
jgi:hypothetical protein